ncbi:MAG: carboxypeptidase-like regulatory domain-containing protein, partial [Longimicrobiales bacterium]
TWRAFAAAVVLASAAPADVRAQDVAIEVMGAVRDAVTEAPIAGATVFIVEQAEEVMSEANGFFVMDDVVPGRLRLVVKAFGYLDEQMTTEVALGDVVLVQMTPEPVDVDGVGVDVARNRLVQRRVALSTPFREFEERTLEVTGSPSVNDFLKERSNLILNQFGRDLCYHRPGDLPGRYFRLPIYWDEARVSHDVFWNLQPRDLALLEVYPRLPMVRAYSKRFMEDMRAGKISVMPLELQQSLELC